MPLAYALISLLKRCKTENSEIWLDNGALRERGVKIFGGEVYIEEGCTIEEGVQIFSPAYIKSRSRLSRGAIIKPFSYIENSQIGTNSIIFASVLIGAYVGSNCNVGPYAHLRAGANIGDCCRVGGFVEIKDSVLGESCKAAHLSYIGDAVLGKRVNVGCGVVFANFNGKIKQHSAVSDDVFIGSNCNIIAPVNIQRGAYIAAGTTVTRDVNEYALCIGRAREKVLEGGGYGRY